MPLTTPVETYADIQASGDYYVDHAGGVIYFYAPASNFLLNMSFSFKFHTWNGYTIAQPTGSLTHRVIDLDGCTIEHIGAPQTFNHDFYNANGISAVNARDSVTDPTRLFRVTNCEFVGGARVMRLDGCSGTALNRIEITGNTFRHVRRISSDADRYQRTIGLHTCNYVAINDNVYVDCPSAAGWNGGLGFGTRQRGITFNRNRGRAEVYEFVAGNAEDAEVCDNIFVGWGGLANTTAFDHGGSEGRPNRYERNLLWQCNRAARLKNHMVVRDNIILEAGHHGFVMGTSNGYYDGATIEVTGNILGRCRYNMDMGGGFTFGYNYNQWLDRIVIERNTFDDGARTIELQDNEWGITTVSRAIVRNNLCTNSESSFSRNTSSGTTRAHFAQGDYNVEFNNANAAIGGRVKTRQSTAMRECVAYNTDEGKQCKGISLWNPSATLPTTVPKSVSLVVAGEKGTDFSASVSFDDGVAAPVVKDQGVATGGAASSVTYDVYSTGKLIDATRAWTTNELRGGIVEITAPGGTKQWCYISSNDATSLVLYPQRADRVLTAPEAGSTYVVYTVEVVLPDGANTVSVGIYPPDLPSEAGAYTDTGITFDTHEINIDPQYLDVSRAAAPVALAQPDPYTFVREGYTPQNPALKGAGYGGVDIGAMAVGEAPVDPVDPPAPGAYSRYGVTPFGQHPYGVTPWGV